MKDELDRKRQQLASTAAGGKTPAPVEIGRLQEILSQIGLPDSLRPPLEPSRIPS
jgi:hypothetical protein